MTDESLYEKIAAELAAGQQKPGIWLKALTDANDNEATAKVEYV